MRWIGLIVSLLIGIAAVGIGGHDAFAAARITERFAGSIIAVTGLALVASAVRVMADGGRFRDRGYAILGFVLGACPGVSLMLIQLSSFDYSSRVILWAFMALIPLAVAVAAWAGGARPSSKQSTALVTLGGTVLAVTLPLIAGAFRPVFTPQILNVEAMAAISGYREDQQLGRVAVLDVAATVRNISPRRLVFLASTYTVLAVKRPPHDAPISEDDLIRRAVIAGWSARFQQSKRFQPIQAGHLYPLANFLEPGQHDVRRFPAVVPLELYDTAEIVVEVATAYADRVLLGEQIESGHAMQHLHRLRATSWINHLMVGRQLVHVQYEKRDTNGPHLAFRIGVRPEDGDGTFNEHFAGTFGIAQSGATHQLALVPGPVSGP